MASHGGGREALTFPRRAEAAKMVAFSFEVEWRSLQGGSQPSSDPSHRQPPPPLPPASKLGTFLPPKSPSFEVRMGSSHKGTRRTVKQTRLAHSALIPRSVVARRPEDRRARWVLEVDSLILSFLSGLVHICISVALCRTGSSAWI